MLIKINKFQYDTKNIIGKGGFGNVYYGYDDDNNKVAIKVDKKKKYNNKESLIYKLLDEYKLMPKMIDYIEEEKKSYLVLPLYGYNSNKIVKMKPDEYFNIKDILMLGIQILQQLNYLHKKNIIHNDIKPDNFIYDYNNNKFKLIDYGLSDFYINGDKHIEFSKSNSRCGTLRYMSINCHNKYSLSRRDDLISLSYSLIYLYIKTLPWKNITICNNRNKLYNKVLDIKKKFNEEIKDYDLPSPILFLYRYSSDLNFNKDPDYNHLIKTFYLYLKLNKLKYDGKWSFYDEFNKEENIYVKIHNNLDIN